MPNLGAPELLVILVAFVPLAISIFALVDIVRRPESQFSAVGQSRTTWIIVAALSIVVPCLFLAAAYYLVAVRPKLAPRTIG